MTETVRRSSTPNKRNPENIKKILQGIGSGHTIEKACLLVPIDERSWARWRKCKNPLEAGTDELGIPLSDDQRRCQKCKNCLLQKRCYAAKERFKQHHLNKIAEDKSWVSSAWLLERTSGDEFRVKQSIEVNQSTHAGTANAQKLAGAILAAAAGSGQPVNQGA